MINDRGLEGRQILVVEDDFWAASDLRHTLEDAGAQVAGPIGNVSEALEMIAECGRSLAGAVLDINLHGATCYPVANALRREGVRFVFVSAYGPEAVAAEYRSYPFCEKPVTLQQVLKALVP